MKNLKLKLTIIGITLLSINAFSQDYIYKGVKNVDATIGMNDSESDSEQETVSADCYDSANIGKRIQAQGCKDLLIVDNDSLRQMVLNDENYSDTNIFTGQVTDMSFLFCNYNLTNQELYNNCTRKDPMYSISNWNTANVINMKRLFLYSNFNQPLNNWDVSNVTNMFQMFRNTNNFNQPLNNWDVSNVTDMSDTFARAYSFNQPLNNWDVSNVNDMSYMFYQANQFNQPLNNWNVINVTDMRSMFLDSAYNQPLNNWNVINVTNMRSMFRNSTYNQDISNWCVPLISSKPNYFDDSSGFENQTHLQPNWGCN